MGMKVTTRATLARDAVARAKAQPGNGYEWAVKLRALSDDATPDQVDAAVGHGGQTWMRCHECGTDKASMVVTVGEPPDYESSTADLCAPCIRKAVAMVEEAEVARFEAFITAQREGLKATIEFVRTHNPDLDDDGARALVDKYIADERAALTAMLERKP
jgi:hypothetical protein